MYAYTQSLYNSTINTSKFIFEKINPKGLTNGWRTIQFSYTRNENSESSDYKNISDEVKYGCDRSWENTIFHASF